MALIVEDGSIVANSNTYMSVASAGTYMENRTDANWTSASTTEKEDALFLAGMYLNSLDWKGQKVDRDQTMELPRVNLYDNDRYLYSYTAIPLKVKNAQVEAALAHLGGYSLFPTNTPDSKIKRKKIDVLEKEFFPGAASGRTDFTAVDSLVSEFLESAGKIARA